MFTLLVVAVAAAAFEGFLAPCLRAGARFVLRVGLPCDAVVAGVVVVVVAGGLPGLPALGLACALG